ncbi:MAG: hypothetical protein JNJ57_13550 [Saprospiraceae bacterium]|nr:hypothetical protein [Saprospiraceae bacterium]
MKEVISTWIYLDSSEESSEYPQVGKASHLPEFQKVYWRCVAVFFSLSVQNNTGKKHLLFTNVPQDKLPEIDGLDMGRFLKEKNVEVVTLPLTWQAPKGWHGKWRNQFYIFDILQFIENQKDTPEATDTFIVLDSDCIINRSLDSLFEKIRKSDLLVLPLGYPDDFNINGITRVDMRHLYAELDGIDPGSNPEYFGGEVFAASFPVIKKINAIAPVVWQHMLERFKHGRPKFNEEAHFLSYCYHKIGSYGTLDGSIKRIWTSPKYQNVQAADVELPIWHLPAEKTGGIALIFKQLNKKDWSVTELSGYLGIPIRTKYLNLKHYLKYTWLYKWLNN